MKCRLAQYRAGKCRIWAAVFICHAERRRLLDPGRADVLTCGERGTDKPAKRAAPRHVANSGQFLNFSAFRDRLQSIKAQALKGWRGNDPPQARIEHRPDARVVFS